MSYRQIVGRHTQFAQHGPITALIRPQGLGEQLKPFVFLDHLRLRSENAFGFGFHPHSGIATLTSPLRGDVGYEDTTGQKGIVKQGGLEWMLAGGGVWHQAELPAGDIEGLQLWLALPPGVEDGPSEGAYLSPEEVASVGNVRVLLGEYAGAKSKIRTGSPVNYFDVTLAEQEVWEWEVPVGHGVAWYYVLKGTVSQANSGEMVVLGAEGEKLRIEALEDSRVLVGTAVKHEYPLVLGPSSVHTNVDSLKAARHRMGDIQRELVKAGKM